MKNLIIFIGLIFVFVLFITASNNPNNYEDTLDKGRGKIIADKPTPGGEDDLTGFNLKIVVEKHDGEEKQFYVGELCPDSNLGIPKGLKFKVEMCNFPCWFNFGCEKGDYVEYIKKGNTIYIVGYIQDPIYHN